MQQEQRVQNKVVDKQMLLVRPTVMICNYEDSLVAHED